jgi:hypothetical protein
VGDHYSNNAKSGKWWIMGVGMLNSALMSLSYAAILALGNAIKIGIMLALV